MSRKPMDITTLPLHDYNGDLRVGLNPHASEPLTYEDNVWDLTSEDYGPFQDEGRFHIAVGRMLSQLADPKKGQPVQLAYAVAMNLMDKDGKVVFKDGPSGRIMELPEVESHQAYGNLTAYAQKWETGDPTVVQDWPFVLGIALLVIRGQYRAAKSSSSRMKRDSALTEIMTTISCDPSDREAISAAIAATADVERIERHVDEGVQSSFLKQSVLYLTSKPTDTVATKFLEFFVMDGAAAFNGLPFLRLVHQVSTAYSTSAYSTSVMRILNYCTRSWDLETICSGPVRILFRVFEEMEKLQYPERVRYSRALSDGYFSELSGRDMNRLTGTLALLFDIAENANGRESNSYQKLCASREGATAVEECIKNKLLALGMEGIVLEMNAQTSGDDGTDPNWLKRVFGEDCTDTIVNSITVADDEHLDVADVNVDDTVVTSVAEHEDVAAVNVDTVPPSSLPSVFTVAMTAIRFFGICIYHMFLASGPAMDTFEAKM